MKFLIAFNAAVVVLIGLIGGSESINIANSMSSAEFQWMDFKTTHAKQYSTAEEEHRRKEIFLSNLDFIEKHNELFKSGEKSFELGINQFADWTLEEFKQKSISADLAPAISDSEIHFNLTNEREPEVQADEVDWTEHGWVAPIDYEGPCDSDYAFSAAAAIEGQLAKKTGKLTVLSEQQLVDCSEPYGNHGCDGGLPEFAFKYVLEHGIANYYSYPYEYSGKDICRAPSAWVATKISSFHFVTFGNETALQNAVANVGPISVMVDGSSQEFMLYKSGVFDLPSCSTTEYNHAVAVVGYGSLQGQKYWKIKNSYGYSWGQDGYMLMIKDKGNQCAIATRAAYPLI